MAIGTNKKVVDAKLEAATLFFGRGQCRKITFVADVAGSLDGTYFDLNVIDGEGNEVLGYVYYGADPAIAGKTGYPATISNDDDAAAVAAATNTALASVGVFTSLSGSELSIENHYPAAITAETDSGSTGFTFLVESAGYGGLLGSTSEAVSVSTEVTTVDVVANQFGSQILDQVISGVSVSISASLLEMTQERWESILGNGVGSVNEDGSSNVVGLGDAKNFQNLSDQDGRLIIHPKRLASTDRSADWVMWRSAPVPESFDFDGNALQSLAVTFTGYLTSNRDASINLFCRGDWTQSELIK